MTAAAWLAQKLGRLFQVFAGLCVLALIAGTLLHLLGDEDQFTTVFSDRPESYGTFLWRTAAVMVGCYVAWRLLFSFVIRFGTVEHVARMLDLEPDPEPIGEPTHACSACGESFTSWDAAYDHAERDHGSDRMPEELRLLIHPTGDLGGHR